MTTSFLDLVNYWERINRMSRDELMEEGNKLIVRAQALDNKDKAMKLACQSRSKSVPKNATIRKEFVKCKKPNCYRKQHGLYYYVYWKDHETKRLRKKYIGRHFILWMSKKDKKLWITILTTPFSSHFAKS